MKKYSVLVVEDEPIILRHIVRKVNDLSDYVYVFAAVENAEEALQIMKKNKIEILLTDIEMNNMSGLQLIEQVKEKWPAIRVMILSGYDYFQYAQSAVRYGVDDYLLKPIDSEGLEKAFSRVIKKIKEPCDEKKEKPLTLPEQIEAKLNEFYNRPITMADLVECFSYAPSYISRIFKRKYHTSPMQYQTNLRVSKAKELLKQNNELTVQEVAREVGYEDAKYFSRVFRQATGLPPSEWGKQE